MDRNLDFSIPERRSAQLSKYRKAKTGECRKRSLTDKYGIIYALRGRKRNKMKNIFRYMMEEGYNPSFEHSHIQFELDGNIAVVEYEDGFASVRIFFSIDEYNYDLFIEASNRAMIKTYVVKPTVLDDRQNIVFSYEFICDSIRDFKRYFHRGLDCLRETLAIHKEEMRHLIASRNATTKAVPDIDEIISGTARKILS